MVAANAKDVLKKENELLSDLQQRASASASVGEGWAQFFKGWRAANDRLIAMADSAFEQEVNAEIKRLESMRNAITGDSPGATFWKESLGFDIDNSKELL
jgi:hypothetical protein